MNRAYLNGKIANDVEMKTIGEYKATEFDVLVSNGENKGVEFFPVLLWGKAAEAAAEKLKKDDYVEITGRLDSQTYKSKDGKTKTAVKIIGDSFSKLAEPSYHKEVFLQGRICSEPELVKTSADKSASFITVAYNNPYSKDENAQFYSVSAWDKTAENVTEYLHKGDMITLFGNYDMTVNEKDGIKYHNFSIKAREIEFPVRQRAPEKSEPAEPVMQPDEGRER